MPVIDADTHIDETEDTWAFMSEAEARLKPQTGYPSNPDPTRRPTRYWMIDGRRTIRFIRNDEQTGTTVETRELLDVDARLRDMDKMGVDIQVIYPTLFTVEFTEDAEVERTLRRSYNRWMADRYAKSDGRLPWIMLPPTMSMPAALEEMQFAKEHGACGVLKKGNEETGRWPADPYFFPLYEEAARLDMPLCFHVGTGVADFTSVAQLSLAGLYRTTFPVIHAFQTFIQHGIPAQFPGLRSGFIEATASWVPFIVYRLQRTLRKNIERPDSQLRGFGDQYELAGDLLKANRMYISCQVDEDLPYLLRSTGEDNLLIGSDYTHNDAAQERDFVQLLQKQASAGTIPQSLVSKMTYDNPKTFYGL